MYQTQVKWFILKVVLCLLLMCLCQLLELAASHVYMSSEELRFA